MIHEILPVGMLQCNCSVLGDEASKEAIVVDPGDEIEEIVAILERHQLRVKYIVITHAHIDHIGGAAKLKKLTGAPVYLNEQDFELYNHLGEQALWLGVEEPERTAIDAVAKEGDTIRWGAQKATVMHTPGHTQGSICLLVPQPEASLLLAGDTLFRSSIGRTDLPGGNMAKILASLKNKLLALEDATIVVPGHGPKTTIGREREMNPFLQGL